MCSSERMIRFDGHYLFFFQYFQQRKGKRWVVVEDKFEVFVGACEEVVEGAEGSAGLVGGLQVPGWIVEKTAVEDDGDAWVFAASCMTQVNSAAVSKRKAGASCGTGEQGPALFGEMAGVGAQIGGFVEVVDADAVAGFMKRCGTIVEKIGDEGSKGAVGADFRRKGRAAQLQCGMVSGKKSSAVAGGIKVQFWDRLKGQKQGGVTGLRSAGESVKIVVAQVLGIVDEEQTIAAAKGGRVNVANPIDVPA